MWNSSTGLLRCFPTNFSMKRIFRIFSRPRPREKPADLAEGVWPLWFVGAAFWFTRRYGGLFLLGLILDVLLSRL